jgi:energy-coupling factor transport system substrate-specific component
MTWQAGSFALLAVALAAGFAWYERSRPQAKVLSLVAALAALAVVGRLAFAAFPNVKPTTDIVLFAGYALGPAPGFAVGAVTALASNIYFTQGPWTPWQMFAWGAVGAGGGLLGRAVGRELGRWPLALACGLAGAFFGAVMDTYQWTLAARQDLPTWFAVSASSSAYNAAHVIGNVVFCLLIGPPFVRALRRYRRRFEVRWEPAGAAAAALAALALAGAVVAAAPATAAASPTSRAVSYLAGAQNGDGGFGGARGQSSTHLHTGWTALGLAAGGRNPRDVRRDGNSAIDFMKARAGELRDVGELERTILVLRASGLPARLGDRDLVAELLRRRRSDGSWGRNVAHTAFGVLALRAARRGSLGGPARWLERSQNRDGGFGFVRRAASDVDDTGAALQALAAAGRRGTVTSRAIGYLRRAQNSDGGFGQMRGRLSNAQSTAWAVQGLVAVGRGADSLRRGGRTPLGFLRSLQAGDGSVRYSRRSRQTPVWVTAQAVTALARKAFPLRPLRSVVAARGRARGGAGGAEGGGARANGGDSGAARGGAAGGGDERLGPPAPPGPGGAAQRVAAARAAGSGDGGGFPWLLAFGGVAAVALLAGGIWRARRRHDPAAGWRL